MHLKHFVLICCIVWHAPAFCNPVEPEEPVLHAAGSGYPFGIAANLDEQSRSKRFIEPTSPILGEKLSAHIKNSELSPKALLQQLYSYGPALESELATSCIAYFNVMLPQLQAYQNMHGMGVIPEETQEFTEVECSAIPLEVLLPLHRNYARELTASNTFYQVAGLASTQDSAARIAGSYQQQKEACPSILPVLRKDNPWKNYLPNRVERLLEINTSVSSAESAYPRVQHSINGYVRSIYRQLLENDRLELLLESSFQASDEWIQLQESGNPKCSYMSHVQQRLVQQGFTSRDALLMLCYFCRNMPNIDVEYASHPKQALALEVYFWKMKDILSQVANDHLDEVFPNHYFKRNPMLYHYATAAYLAYEIRMAGYVRPTAIFFAFASKAGYKAYKYKHALSHELVMKNGVSNLAELFKAQSSLPGIEAGYYGGVYGVDLAVKDLAALQAAQP